jgi:hypothetical protein
MPDNVSITRVNLTTKIWTEEIQEMLEEMMKPKITIRSEFGQFGVEFLIGGITEYWKFAKLHYRSTFNSSKAMGMFFEYMLIPQLRTTLNSLIRY